MMHDTLKATFWTGLIMVLLCILAVQIAGCAPAELARDLAVCATNPRNCN